MKSKSGWILCILLLLGSCRVPRDVVYFQGLDDLTRKQTELMNQTYHTKICADDMLTINVSAEDPTVVAGFNPPAFGYNPQGEMDMNMGVQNLFSYLVDRDGNINFPVAGQVHLAGLTVHEANKTLQDLIVHWVPDALVNVQIVNFKVGIFGEVTRTNMYPIPNSRISILDLIAMAGDLTINANRKNILLIRDNDGQKEYARFDITDPDIFASPYFYLKQNDLVYVEPNNAKIRNANYSSAQQYTLTIFSTIMTGASVITTIILAISNSVNK
ncbi:MAG: polysaccharide biosynthesis/export family protein [Tannerella sp.]|jgi:polysaccharide export outer membrane protein|nr:polysaccharide biosynthesis/export family protein [Tannerella sp.]